MSHPGRRQTSSTIFRIHFLRKVHKQILNSDVFQRHQIMGIERNISTVASLMKQILRNENHADISVIAAFRKYLMFNRSSRITRRGLPPPPKLSGTPS